MLLSFAVDFNDLCNYVSMNGKQKLDYFVKNTDFDDGVLFTTSKGKPMKMIFIDKMMLSDIVDANSTWLKDYFDEEDLEKIKKGEEPSVEMQRKVVILTFLLIYKYPD